MVVTCLIRSILNPGFFLVLEERTLVEWNVALIRPCSSFVVVVVIDAIVDALVVAIVVALPASLLLKLNIGRVASGIVLRALPCCMRSMLGSRRLHRNGHD